MEKLKQFLDENNYALLLRITSGDSFFMTPFIDSTIITMNIEKLSSKNKMILSFFFQGVGIKLDHFFSLVGSEIYNELVRNGMVSEDLYFIKMNKIIFCNQGFYFFMDSPHILSLEYNENYNLNFNNISYVFNTILPTKHYQNALILTQEVGILPIMVSKTTKNVYVDVSNTELWNTCIKIFELNDIKNIYERPIVENVNGLKYDLIMANIYEYSIIHRFSYNDEIFLKNIYKMKDFISDTGEFYISSKSLFIDNELKIKEQILKIIPRSFELKLFIIDEKIVNYSSIYDINNRTIISNPYNEMGKNLELLNNTKKSEAVFILKGQKLQDTSESVWEQINTAVNISCPIEYEFKLQQEFIEIEENNCQYLLSYKGKPVAMIDEVAKEIIDNFEFFSLKNLGELSEKEIDCVIKLEQCNIIRRRK